MADWDENSPGDSDLVSQYPANERAARDAVRSNFGVDHHEANDADVGKHEVIQILDNGADPTIDAGQVGVWNNGGELRMRTGGGAAQAVSPIEPGTNMLFFQAAAPTGWTQDTSVNDRVLKVVSGAGGGTGGSWTISGVTVDNHTLTTSQIPSHSHSASTGGAGGHNHGGSTGSDGGHSHSASTGSAGSHRHSILDEWDGGGSNSTREQFGHPDATYGSSPTASYRQNTDDGTNTPFLSAAGGHSHSVSVGSVSNHNHTISSVSNHTHSVSVGSTGGGNAHNHGLTADGSWRPSHINVIAATKD